MDQARPTSASGPSTRTKSSTARKNADGDFVCDCGKTFSRIENLTRHARNHNASQTWACPHCPKSFVRPDLYKRHLKIHPTGSANRDSLDRQDQASRASIAPSEMGSVDHGTNGAKQTTSESRSKTSAMDSGSLGGDARGPSVEASRVRRVAELYPAGDDEPDHGQSNVKRSRVNGDQHAVTADTRTDKADDRDRDLERYPPTSPYSESVSLVFNDNQQLSSGSATPGPMNMHDGVTNMFHNPGQGTLEGSARLSLPLQGIDGLTTLASTAAGARSPSRITELTGEFPRNLQDGSSFQSKGSSVVKDSLRNTTLNTLHASDSHVASSSRLGAREMFGTGLESHSAAMMGNEQSLDGFPSHVSGTLDPGYGSSSMDMQMQTSGFNLQQTMVWDALGQFGEGDALQWDEGMHWMLDDATRYFGSLTDTAHQNVQSAFGALNQDPMMYAGETIPFDVPTVRSEDNKVDSTMLSYFLSEINQLRPYSNNVASSSGDRQHHDAYTGGPARGMGWFSPAHAAPGQPVSASVTRANSPRAGMYSRAGSNPPEETAEDRWPMNWQPAGRAFTLGASKNIAELGKESDIELHLRRWNRYWIDERMRKMIANSFSLAKAMPGPDVSHFVMPGSIHTVNHFISLYFEHFHEQLPILHLPTFDSAQSPPLLVAALICVGACYSDRSGARTFAVEMIEVLRKTLNALFEHDSTNLRSASLIHVYLLVMLSGLLIGNKRTYELAEASRGTLINLCRRADLLGAIPASETARKFDTPDERWRAWAILESRKRLGVAICLVDTIFPAVLDIPAYHSHGEMLKTALPCDELYFDASTAKAWTNLLGSSNSPPCPFFIMVLTALMIPIYVPDHHRIPPIPCLNPFAAMVAVSALHHHIYEFRSQLSTYVGAGLPVPIYRPGSEERLRDGFEGRKQWLKESLETWRKEYYDSFPDSSMMNNARALYHLGHVSLSVYVHSLYMATGKRGKQAAIDVLSELQNWAPTEDACHAVKHSLGLLEVLSQSKKSSPYYPLCVFVAILSTWAFVKHLPADNRREEQTTLLGDIERWLAPNSVANNHDDRYIRKRILQKGAKLLAETRAWRIGSAFALVLVKEAEMDLERMAAH